MIELRRILCPTDLSEMSGRAFDDALALARWYGSEIRLLYVVEPLWSGQAGPLPWPSWTLLNPGVRERLQASLQEMAEPAAALGVPVQCEVREGSPVAEILDEARGLPADALVMGTHGRGGSSASSSAR